MHSVHPIVPRGEPQIMPYMTGRGVCFAPHRTVVGKCLKCARSTRRLSRLTFGSLAKRHVLGSTYLQTMKAPIPICRRCERRWTLSIILFILSLLLPIAVPMLADRVFNGINSDSLVAVSFPLSFLGILGMWLWARRKMLRVKSIDEDGMLELAGVHPAVAAEIAGDY